MKQFVSCLLIMGAGLSALGQSRETGPVQRHDPLAYVDPFIGTAKSNAFTRWGNEGGTYPGAVAPWGMMQLTPETKASGGYDYGDSTLYFFSCWRHLSGYPGGSGGQIKIMPMGPSAGGSGTAAGFDRAVAGEGGWMERKLSTGRLFRHSDEQASPGYYRVTFPDDHSMVEVTASGRVGLFRCTFPAHIVPRIFVGGMGKITSKDARSLQGDAVPVVLRYDHDTAGVEPVKDGVILQFAPSVAGKTVIILRISVSMTGLESAGKNIDQETGGLGFDRIKERTASWWRKELSVIHIGDEKEIAGSKDNGKNEHGDHHEEKKKIFYTALYHSLLLPWIISDVDGKYKGRDGLIHMASGKNEYGQFSPWDTFRSLHPLLCLLFPERQQDMVRSMLDIYHQTGHLPTDPMTGNHALAVIADSWLKGIHGFDSMVAYGAMKRSLVDTPFLQSDMEVYRQRGYIPFTYPESVTRTVEYAYDDWVLGQFAGLVLHEEKEKELWEERSYHYRNLFNPDELLFLPRDGEQFRLQPGTTGYKEGDKWVYSFFVPQHVNDLVNLMGGEDAFVTRLDSALTSQAIVFDNETVFHIPYLFNYAGRPDRTQYWVKTIMNDRFSATPGGLPGNDDLGSLSSWYVLSAMGIYPVCPGRPFYDIGSPLFSSVELHLQNGKKIVIRSRNTGGRDVYVKSWQFNSKKQAGFQLSHALIERGGEVDLEMSDKPGRGGLADSSEGQPDFRIGDFLLSKKEVTPHELFWIRFSIRNSGSTGTKIIKLLSDGREVAHKNIVVGAGITVVDSIGCRLYPYGMAEVRVEGMPAVGVNVVRTGKGLEEDNKTRENGGLVEITGLAARPMLRKGEGQKISFTAQNIGGDPHSFYIPVRLNDSLVRIDTLLLEPGEKKVISQELAVSGEGMQVIGVMGEQEKFSIYSRNEESVLLDLSPGAAPGDNVAPDQSGFANWGRVVRTGDVTQGKDGQAKGLGRLLLGKYCYVEIPNAPSLDSMGETLTMMAWVYPVAGGGDLVDLLAKGDNHVLQIVDNKSLGFFAGGWGRGDCTVDLPADWLGHWHHIAGVCEGSTLRLYIDGMQKGSARVEGRVNLSNTQKWTLGRNEEFPGKRIFNGYMERVKIFEAPLTGDEVKGITDKERLFIFCIGK